MTSYTYDPRLRGGAGGYRDDSNGRIVPLAEARDALDRTLQNAEDPIRALFEQIRERRISLADWQLQMRELTKNAHISAAVTARGGFDQMSQADWGRVVQRIRNQYEFLDNFAQQIASGQQPLDGRTLLRMQMYQDSAIETYLIFENRQMTNAGFNEERSVLDSKAQHCGDCPTEAAKGWVPIGTLIPIGQRQCLTRCRCTMEYRNTALGVVVR